MEVTIKHRVYRQKFILFCISFTLFIGHAHAVVDLTDSTQYTSADVDVSSTYKSYNRRTGEMIYSVSMSNTSSRNLDGDLYLEIGSISSDGVKVNNADDVSQFGTAVFRLPDSGLSPGQTISQSVVFLNQDRTRFSFSPLLHAASNDFVKKAAAISINQIRLYDGFVKNVNPDTMSELDPTSLNSGQLITVDVLFELADNLSDYSLTAQLAPEAIYSQFNSGTTIGEIFDPNATAAPGVNLIDLGGAQISEILPGIMHGVFEVKLPTSNKDMSFKIVVSPSLNFLAAGKDLKESDVAKVPMFVDSRELMVSKLDSIAIKLTKEPNLSDDNDFTALDTNVKFGENGYSNEPIFQTSVGIDMATFNADEEVVLSVSWKDALGNEYPLGLMGNDATGNPTISTDPHFLVKQTRNSGTSLPVIVHVPVDAQEAMLREATFIKDIGSQSVKNANFDLQISYVDQNSVVTPGGTYSLSLPLISLDSSPLVLSVDDSNKFAVLRAGTTNSACLTIESGAFDIDTGLLNSNATNVIEAANCSSPPSNSALWRYDVSTQHFVSKVLDNEGDNHCIAATGGTFLPSTFSLEKCKYGSTNGAPGQRFEFDDKKIRLSIAPLYIGVGPVSLFTTSEPADGANFSTDLNGLDIDSKGRIFSASRYYDRNWGLEDFVQVSIAYGGEANVDYLPVIGAGSKGKVEINASLLGVNQSVLNTRYSLQRHLTKKISLFGNNYPDTVVENGANLEIDLFGRNMGSYGSITSTPVTETFNSLELTNTMLGTMPASADVNPANIITLKVDEPFVNITFIVIAVPVTIAGGIDALLSFDVSLTNPGVGMEVDTSESIALSGYLNAVFDALVVDAGLGAEVEVVNQTLDFSVINGFTAPPDGKRLDYTIGASLDANLSLLKGEMSGFIEYVSPCPCIPPWETVRKETVVFSTDYLFNNSWNIFSANASKKLIQY